MGKRRAEGVDAVSEAEAGLGVAGPGHAQDGRVDANPANAGDGQADAHRAVQREGGYGGGSEGPGGRGKRRGRQGSGTRGADCQAEGGIQEMLRRGGGASRVPAIGKDNVQQRKPEVEDGRRRDGVEGKGGGAVAHALRPKGGGGVGGGFAERAVGRGHFVEEARVAELG